MDRSKLPKLGDDQVESLGKVVIGMLAIGLTGGIALIAAAKKIGDTFLSEDDSEKSGDTE